MVRYRRRRLPKGLAVVTLLALGGCAAFGGAAAPGRAGAENWLAFGASLSGSGPSEFDALRETARQAYASRPTADSAIRLAILEASPANASPNLALAMRLLDEASVAGDSDEDDIVFVAFFRPWVANRQEQEAARAAALAESRSLRQQLNALRALEEQIDVND